MHFSILCHILLPNQIEFNLIGFDCVGADAIFSISTAKPGNGVEQLRDDRCAGKWIRLGRA